MKRRLLAGASALALASPVIANTYLARQAEDLEPALSGTQHTFHWRGFDVAYTEAGDPDDPDILLLHGINAAASSQEWAELFDALAEDYHVIAPDLPGFGSSERHPVTYDAEFYTNFVSEFAAAITEDATWVASSLTSAYAAAAAEDADCAELVLICPTTTTMGQRPWVQTLIRLPILGQTLFNLVASKRSIRHFSADHSYYDEAEITDERTDYEWQTAHQPGARFAPAAFVSGALDSDIDLGETLAALDVPVTIVWGNDADISPVSEGRELAKEADAKLFVFKRAKLLPHVERSEKVFEKVFA
ncbi:alpha/beta fold hydrolase [Haladaptatus sp. DYSN1]|uniref:alpha/beta fold hydrolase n=1 Tax=unclassified Haladaptatus TaxID=2622732 RepID=UPI0024067B27|nr:alpha/beta fold hydrolase [Haladaptatus sp. DYSN1]